MTEKVAADTFTRADGTIVEFVYDDQVAPDAPLLIFHHGTPAAGPIDPLVLDAARIAHLRTISLIRPGYGRSTRTPGRTVADMASLSGELADHLGHDRFLTAGWSGGGPHAIATTALLADRCPAAISIAGVAPYDAQGLDFLAGMGQDNIEEFGAAVESNAKLEEFLSAMAEPLSHVSGDDVIESMGSLLPEADRKLLREGHGEALASEIRWSLANGIWGWFDDDIAFTKPWGFDLSTVKNPVTILQGSEDLMVPFTHGEWLAKNVKNATAKLISGEGHLSVAVGTLHDEFARMSALL